MPGVQAGRVFNLQVGSGFLPAPRRVVLSLPPCQGVD